MAHIEIRNLSSKGGAGEIIINGVDFSMETYADGIQLVEVGDDPDFAEVGLQVTFVVSRLDIDNEADVQVTDRLPVVAQRVRSVIESASESLDGEN